MAIDGDSWKLQATAEAPLWLKDKERSLSPVLFCLDSEYAANATQGASQVHTSRNVQIRVEKDKQLCTSRRSSTVTPGRWVQVLRVLSYWRLSVPHLDGGNGLIRQKRAKVNHWLPKVHCNSLA